MAISWESTFTQPLISALDKGSLGSTKKLARQIALSYHNSIKTGMAGTPADPTPFLYGKVKGMETIIFVALTLVENKILSNSIKLQRAELRRLQKEFNLYRKQVQDLRAVIKQLDEIFIKFATNVASLNRKALQYINDQAANTNRNIKSLPSVPKYELDKFNGQINHVKSTLRGISSNKLFTINGFADIVHRIQDLILELTQLSNLTITPASISGVVSLQSPTFVFADIQTQIPIVSTKVHQLISFIQLRTASLEHKIQYSLDKRINALKEHIANLIEARTQSSNTIKAIRSSVKTTKSFINTYKSQIIKLKRTALSSLRDESRYISEYRAALTQVRNLERELKTTADIIDKTSVKSIAADTYVNLSLTLASQAKSIATRVAALDHSNTLIAKIATIESDTLKKLAPINSNIEAARYNIRKVKNFKRELISYRDQISKLEKSIQSLRHIDAIQILAWTKPPANINSYIDMLSKLNGITIDGKKLEISGQISNIQQSINLLNTLTHLEDKSFLIRYIQSELHKLNLDIKFNYIDILRSRLNHKLDTIKQHISVRIQQFRDSKLNVMSSMLTRMFSLAIKTYWTGATWVGGSNTNSVTYPGKSLQSMGININPESTIHSREFVTILQRAFQMHIITMSGVTTNNASGISSPWIGYY